MNSAHGTAALPAVGFPIRTSPDQSLVSGSPTLFAATHVLLRLLSPRHPSCALSSLVISLPCSFTFSRRPGSSAAPWLTGNKPDSRPARAGGHRSPFGWAARRRRVMLFEKEVIQPQAPLGLPGSDFTPVPGHALGAAFPCGLGKPLLEQLTPRV